jgi:membrane protein DedA with SNARE-associated domain
LLEAVPVLGSIVPGSTIILSLSALIATGDLNPAGVLGSAIAGAMLGDGTAYWLGHRHPGQGQRMWPLNRHPDLVLRSETFFQRYGNAAVFFARFLPPVRAFVPITAGALGMTPRRFFTFDIAAILVWAPMHVVPGVLAGTAYRHAGVMAEHLLLPVVAGLIGVAVVVWGVRRWLQR